MEGLEPPHLAASDPKSDVSTNSTTSGDPSRCVYLPIVIGIHHIREKLKRFQMFNRLYQLIVMSTCVTFETA